MLTGNSLNSGRVNYWVLGAGLVLCLFLHLALLSGKPGLHFDEAWAMNYSWRIAAEPGFWPWRAMSPYTFPVAHYWAAAWLKALGPSLLVFRLSQVALSLSGVFLLTYELLRAGYARAASYLPLAVVFLPGLLLNHRFAIELNGLHPFLFAIMLGALLREKPGRAGICFVVASMAHILFYGVGLGLVAACLWERRKFSGREYRALSVAALALAVFFSRVLLSIPEHGKAAALLLSALAIPVVAHPGFSWPNWRPRWLPGALAAVFLFNLLFFAEGTWSVAIMTGVVPPPSLLLEAAFFMGLAGWLGFLGAASWPRLLRNWFLFAVFLLGLMMLKPAPRYFELPILALSLAVAFGLAQLNFRKLVLAAIFLAAHASILLLLFFLTAPIEREQRLLFFKDSSRDFLSKQALAHFLGRNGCRLEDVRLADSRVLEALRALSLGDWPAEGKCAWPPFLVRRRADADPAGMSAEAVADFILDDTVPKLK